MPLPPRVPRDDIPVCLCHPPALEGQLGCGEDCLNRISHILCERPARQLAVCPPQVRPPLTPAYPLAPAGDPKTCPCGDRCSNVPFQRRREADMAIELTETRGWGAFAKRRIAKGTFVCEYTGEVVGQQEAYRRMTQAKIEGNPNFYMMARRAAVSVRRARFRSVWGWPLAPAPFPWRARPRRRPPSSAGCRSLARG